MRKRTSKNEKQMEQIPASSPDTTQNKVDEKKSIPSLIEELGFETHEEHVERIEQEIRDTIASADEDYRLILSGINDGLKHYDFGGSKRINTDSFSMNRKFMRLAIRRYIKRVDKRVSTMYSHCVSRMPLNFSSNEVAERHLENTKKEYLAELSLQLGRVDKRKYVNLNEAIEIFIKSRLAATVMRFDGYAAKTLVLYDYDKKLYTFDQYLIGRWLTILTGSASSNNLKTFIATLQSLEDKLAIYNPLPRWKIAVGNGVYNTVTHKLEPQTPLVTITSRIETDYNRFARQPAFVNGVTFERLVKDLANGHPDRIDLIMQMLKTIILGYSMSPAIFIIVGAGGDGKSLFMSLVSNIIGSNNTGSLNFSDMNDDSKTVEVAQKKLILGMDNSQGTIVRNTAFLKSAASKEVVSFFRKYLTSVALRVTGLVVQLCNAIPKFAENGQAMRRRIIAILAENSHYENNDEITGLNEQIKNKHWHEYILAKLLDETQCPFFTDYNDVDKAVLNTALDSDDPIGSFFDELSQVGVLDNSTQVLPRSFVYSAYLDWMTSNYPGSHPHSSRTFNNRASQILREYGFDSSCSQPVRLSTISKSYNIKFDSLFGYLADGAMVKETLNSASATRVWLRTRDTGKVYKRRNGSRKSTVCDAITFFNIWDDVVSDIEHNPESYRDLLDDCKISYEIYDINERNGYYSSNSYIGGLDEDELDDYFEASYARYMLANGIKDELDDGYIPVDLNSLPKPGELLRREVEQQEHDLQTKRQAEREILKRSKQETVVNLDEMDSNEYYELTDTEILENIETLTPSEDLGDFQKQKLFDVTPDIMYYLRNNRRDLIEQVMTWLNYCKILSTYDNQLKLPYAAIVDRLISQIEKLSVREIGPQTVQSLRMVQDDNVSIKTNTLLDTLHELSKGGQ